MSFALSGSIITQSGTDNNLSGLSGISGVTVQTLIGIYPLTIYTLSGRQLKVTGTLTLGSREKLIFTGQGAADYILDVDGGTFNVGEAYTLNSFTTQLPIEAIVFSLSSGGNWNTKNLATRNAGKLIVKNAIIRIPHSIWFEQNGSGQVLLENSIIDKRGSTGDIQTNHGGSVQNNTVFRNSQIYADGQSGLTFRNSNPPTIEKVIVYQARDAWNNESNAVQIIRGLVPNTGSLVDVAQTGAQKTITLVVNAQQGVQFLWGGHLANDTLGNRGEVGVYQELNATVKTPVGTAVQGAIFYLTDTPIAADSTQTALPTPSGGTVNTAQRQVYISSTNTNGEIAQQTILIGSGKRTTGGNQFVGGDSNRVRTRGVNTTSSSDATDDVYNYSILSYSHLLQTNPVTLKSINGSAVTLTPRVINDSNVTLTEANAIAKLASSFSVSTSTNTITVTANSTLDDLYDVMKVFKTRPVQSQLEYPTISTQPVTASGDTLITAMNVVGIEFLTAGVKFKKLQANATSSGTISNLTINGNVTQATPTNLSNVTITGTLTYNTNTATAITITNTTIGTVANSGTGIVTITPTNSTITTYTDAEINYLDSSITISGSTSNTAYPTANDRNNNTNALATWTGEYKFKYAGAWANPIFLKMDIGFTAYKDVTLTLGVNNIDLGTTGLLSSIQNTMAKEATVQQILSKKEVFID